MSDSNSNTENNAPANQDASPAGRQLVVHAQYVKDLSFENPNAPGVLLNSPGQPDVEIGVNVGARALNDGQYEVSLNLTAKAVAGETALFLVELTYAGIVSSPNSEGQDINPMIMIEAPRLLFPFARSIVSDVTRDGGFMPLNIQPIDFVSVYQHNLAKQQEAQRASVTGSEVVTETISNGGTNGGGSDAAPKPKKKAAKKDAAKKGRTH